MGPAIPPANPTMSRRMPQRHHGMLPARHAQRPDVRGSARKPQCAVKPPAYKAGASSATSRRCGAILSIRATIDCKIVMRHTARGEALLEALPNLFTGQMRQTIDRADRTVDILDDKAGEAILD